MAPLSVRAQIGPNKQQPPLKHHYKQQTPVIQVAVLRNGDERPKPGMVGRNKWIYLNGKEIQKPVKDMGGLNKRNEIIVGRAAMLGFASSLVGEAVTGKGIMGQLDMETGLMGWEVQAIVAGLICVSVLSALANPIESSTNPIRGPLQDPSINVVADPKRFFGVSDRYGFTEANELFNGRMAMLGFLASIFTELRTGAGPIESYGMDFEFGVMTLIAFMLFASFDNSGKQ